MRRTVRFFALLLMSAMTLAACGRQAPPPAMPTATSEATAAPTTLPTRVATATPQPTPESTPAADLEPPALVAEAINQRIASEALSVSIEQVYRQQSGAARTWTVDADYHNAGALVEITGDVALVAGANNDTLVSAIVDRHTYLSGPVPALGLDNQGWYQVNGNIGRLSFPRSEFAAFLQQAADPQVLATLEFETNTERSGRPCAVYGADTEASTMALIAMADSAGFPLRDHMPFQQADLNYELCDGALRAIEFAAVVSEHGNLATPREVSIAMVLADQTVSELPDGIEAIATINVEPDAVAGLFDELQPVALPAEPLYSANVFNGGNLRAAPGLNGEVLDQIHAFETVTLHGKSDNGAWYQISNPRGVTGWVSASLLTIDPAVAAAVPVGDHAPTLAVVPAQTTNDPVAEEPAASLARPLDGSDGTSGGGELFIPNSPVEFALVKTAMAQSFQLEMDVTVTGMPTDFTGMPNPNPSQPMTMLRMTGKINAVTEEAQLTLTGAATEFMGGNPDQGIEIVTANGHSYLRGPLPMLGAYENRWYDLGPDAGSMDETLDDPNAMMSEMQAQGIDLDILKQTGSETLDGQTCDVYTVDQAELLALMAELDGSGSLSPEDFADIDEMSIRVWICEDGYFHQFEMLIAGTDPSMPGQPISARILLRIFDYGGNFDITPPTDTLPLEFDTGTMFG